MADTRARLRAVSQLFALIATASLQVCVQYLLNAWNRDFFDALERHEMRALFTQIGLFVPFAAASVVLAVVAVWARMRAQRRWRSALTRHIMRRWLDEGAFRRLDPRDPGHANPEYRIGEDVRIATEAPVELGLALFTSLVTAVTFFRVLFQVGGSLRFTAFGADIVVPGYLVLGVVTYAGVFTAGMALVGRRLTQVIEDKNQAEAEFRAAATLLRECGEGKAPVEAEGLARERIVVTLPAVFAEWRALCRELMRTTWVSHCNFLLTPVVAWFLCAPKYLAGEMSLGELTQTAAAFVTVLGAFNWLVDNFQRFADWRSSVDRVATLLWALDDAESSADLCGVESMAKTSLP